MSPKQPSVMCAPVLLNQHWLGQFEDVDVDDPGAAVLVVVLLVVVLLVVVLLVEGSHQAEGLGVLVGAALAVVEFLAVLLVELLAAITPHQSLNPMSCPKSTWTLLRCVLGGRSNRPSRTRPQPGLLQLQQRRK